MVGDSSPDVGRDASARSAATLGPYCRVMTSPSPFPGVPHSIVVVPCYNEARRLDTRSFARFRADGHWVEFLFVNDGSTDDTLGTLDRLRCASPDTVRVRDQQPNRGKAEAVRAGLLEALDAQPDFVGFWDADLATPLDALPDFIRVMEERPGIDVVMGSRVKLMGRSIERNPWRHYLGRVFATMVSQLLRLAVYDTQCGAKMFRATDRLRAVLSTPFHTSWLFDVEILARMIAVHPLGTAGVAQSVYELPLEEWRDIGGSKLTRAAYVRASLGILALYREYGQMLARQSRRADAPATPQLPA